MSSLLKKIVDADEWDAEDIAGRLGLVLHAAFLFAGFQPYGAQPRSGHLLKQSRKSGSSLCLSRLYTAPDLAHRKGADAAVLMLCVQGSDVALLVFLTADDGDTLENAYLERLDLASVALFLSRSLGGVEPWASRICKSLADGVCWGRLHELCRRNGLLLRGFGSLPDDLKAVILGKLTDGKDLARVECVSSQLRHLVAERDHELWKTLYTALPVRRRRVRWRLWWFLSDAVSSDEESLGLSSSWKDKYVKARSRQRRSYHSTSPSSSDEFIWLLRFFDPIPMIRRKDLPLDYWFQDPPVEEETVPPILERSSGGHRQKLVRRNDKKKKWHGAGAIHSPSSRYRWKHR